MSDLDREHELGQFIPLHYHHNMLLDETRMQGFKSALEHVVAPGARVLELGGGTGVLSYFAAARAERVWCIERNPVLVSEARRILALQGNATHVEVIEGDAFDYLPPEPVDVVICEMLHVAQLREQQLPVIASFKERYRARFGDTLPVFVPEACLQAVQPVEQDFVFAGYRAPVPIFQHPETEQARTRALAEPIVYQTFTYDQDFPQHCTWHETLTLGQSGTLNALRFVTKNILAVLLDTAETIDWYNAYLVLPLDDALQVHAGDQIEIHLDYTAGAALDTLRPQVKLLR